MKPKSKPTIQELNKNLPKNQEQQKPDPTRALPKTNDPHEFFNMYNQEKKTQSEQASTPEQLLRQAEVERKLSNSMLTKQEMQKVIEQIIDLAQHCIQQEDWEAACKMLTKLESTCDIVVNHGDEIEPKIVLFILHNLAYCHQKLDNMNDACAQLEACLQNVELYASDPQDEHIDQLLLKKTEQAVNLQIKLCYQLSSKQKNHTDALNFARAAVGNIHNNIAELVKVAQTLVANSDQHNASVSLFSDQKSDKFIIESNNERKNEIVKQIIATLESISDNFIDRDLNQTKNSLDSTISSIKKSKNVLRSALGVSLRRPWLSELKIEDMFKLEPIQTDEFVLSQDPSVHVTIDSVQEKVIIMVVVQYIFSTELRQLSEGNKKSDRFVESFKQHNKAQEVAKEQLPTDCPIQVHIVNTYEKLFPRKLNFGFEGTATLNRNNISHRSVRSLKTSKVNDSLNSKIENRRVKNANIYDRLQSKRPVPQEEEQQQKPLLTKKPVTGAKPLAKSATSREALGIFPNNKDLYERMLRERDSSKTRKDRVTPREKKRDSKQDLLRELGINMRVIKPLKESRDTDKYTPVKQVGERNDAFIDNLNGHAHQDKSDESLERSEEHQNKENEN